MSKIGKIKQTLHKQMITGVTDPADRLLNAQIFRVAGEITWISHGQGYLQLN